jgi:hypothetical protein
MPQASTVFARPRGSVGYSGRALTYRKAGSAPGHRGSRTEWGHCGQCEMHSFFCLRDAKLVGLIVLLQRDWATISEAEALATMGSHINRFPRICWLFRAILWIV